jgi:hypothetical protein
MTGLPEGAHAVEVRAQDAFGNWGAWASAALVVDQTGPQTSALALKPNPNNGKNAYSPTIQSVRLDATFTDLRAVKSAEFFIDVVGANGSGAPVTPADGLFNAATEKGYAYIPLATVNALAEGNHIVSVHSRDTSGNWGSFATITLIIDKSGPVFTSVSLSPAALPIGTASTTLTVNGASDPSGLAGGEYWIGTTNPAPGGGTQFTGASVSVPTSALSLGSYTVRARLKDTLGNWSAIGQATLTVTSPSLYFSTFGNATVPGVAGSADDADIYFFNSASAAFSRAIDASGPGSLLNLPAGANVDAFDRVDNTHFYLSFNAAVTLPTLGTVQDEDVLFYNAGAWSLFFDGSASGLAATDLDAISLSGGSLFFSTDNTLVPPGAGGSGDDADIYRWNGGSSFTRIIDASALGYPTANVDGLVRLDATHFYLSYSADASLPGLGAAQDEDVVFFNAGTWQLAFDGTARGLTAAGLDIDAFDLP